jgi:hypothetical protein
MTLDDEPGDGIIAMVLKRIARFFVGIVAFIIELLFS